jgi:pimeloyl-ACP methyl ester carboxylesterase
MHFALVHGAYHGAWCWERLRDELERDGHTTSAVDLPCEDPQAGADLYADLVVREIPQATEAVLVGHSLGGLTIPVAASRTPTLMTVYLCALVPVPGLSFDAQKANIGTGYHPSEPPVGHPDGSSSWPETGAIEVFYPDCDPKLAREAAGRLRTQQWRVTQEVTPLREWPSVTSAYVLCRQDRIVSSDYSRRVSRDLLGVEPVEMSCGHSPFLAQPRQLAEMLERESSKALESSTG